MKKISMIVAFVCALSLNSNAQCVQKGNVIVDAYYGFPNLYGVIFKAAVVNSNATGISVSSFGPIGIKGEYLLTDKFGMGLDLNYSTVNVQASSDSVGNPVTYHYKFSTPAIRAMIGFNFHFVRTDKVDGYAAVKAGYLSRTFSFTSDQPGYNFSFSNFVPVAFRLECGMRYFFTEHVGATVNIGLGGGPLIAIGISGKFGGK